MAVNLSPVAGAAAQFFDNSGQVLTGGKLYTYLAGTTTPAVTYTSSSGITAQPNPIILNAAGRVPDSGEIWLSDSVSYKFVLKDQNNVLIGTYDNLVGINSNFVNFTGQEETQTATQGQTVFTLATLTYQPSTNNLLVFVNGSKQVLGINFIETSSTSVTFVDGLNVGDVVDFCTATPINTSNTTANSVSFTGFKGQTGNVQNLADNDGSDWIGFLPAGTNAVARSAQDKMRDIVSVLDFGADSTGATNCSSAVQAALNTGKSIYFPSGTYLINTAVTPLANQKIFGAGMGQTIINSVAQSAVTNIFTITANNVSIADLTININVNGQTQIRAFTFGTGTITTVVGFYMNNVTINGVTAVAGNVGFYINNCNLSNVYISNSQFKLLLLVFYKSNGDTSVQLNHNWTGCYFTSCTDCININSNVSAWSDITVLDCFFFSINQYSVSFAGSTCGRATVTGCHFVTTLVEAIHIEAGANDISIIGNQFSNCSNTGVNGNIHIIDGSNNITITGNSIDGTISGTSSIITIQQGGGASPYDIAISNNTFKCNATNTYGVFISTSNGIALTNNIFNNVNTASKINAFITAASSNIVGYSNYFYNPNYLVSVDDFSGGEISGSNIYGNTSTFNFLTGNIAGNTSIAFRDFSIVQPFTCNATGSVNNPLFGIGHLINGTVGLRYIKNGAASAFITTGNIYYDNTTLTTANVKTYAGASGSAFSAFTQSGGSVCATGYKATSETGVVHVTFSGIIFP